ncbi:DUF1353 domain-containing protein [Roseitranquillus sediminis]|uniref:DUF1353 domain-containing protein n=1 Tax=Roseitranquillus sediminis TaxID=2809051 RepID=UPI001D0CC11F|nr:DUF1353 domain-containing protein [Roseitranquillus sediminis]MBM9596437.1 DUF1353 domain-containing protein [Roseitranquillus sediminis]
MRHDHPNRPTNPYPDRWARITHFAYRSALSLIRPLNTVQTRLGEDGDYILQRDFLVDYAVDGDEPRQIVVPRGMITDLTSVPVPFRVLVGRVGPWLEAAILHDYLYVAWQDIPGRGVRASDRLFADRLMLVAMEEAGVDVFRRRAIYHAIRLFGANAYARPNPDRYAELDDPGLEGSLAFQVPDRHSGTSSTPAPPHG